MIVVKGYCICICKDFKFLRIMLIMEKGDLNRKGIVMNGKRYVF